MSRRRLRRLHALLACIVLGLGFAPGCRAPRNIPVPSNRAAPRSPAVEFELTFLGLCVDAAEWPDAFRFYTERLGMRPRSRDGHWAVFGAGWDAYVTGQSRGLVCELFEGGGTAPAAIEPGLQVRDLARTLERASARGLQPIAFPAREAESAIAPPPATAEVAGPGGVRWHLRQAAGARSSDDLSEPELARVDLRVHDLGGQRAFYHDILGLPRITPADHHGGLWLRQHADGPLLCLTPGGRRHVVPTQWSRQPALGQRAFLGFMTVDVPRAASHLGAAGVRILRDVEHHEWGGTDLIVADADGNAVQVFSLDSDHRFGSARPR